MSPRRNHPKPRLRKPKGMKRPKEWHNRTAGGHYYEAERHLPDVGTGAAPEGAPAPVRRGPGKRGRP